MLLGLFFLPICCATSTPLIQNDAESLYPGIEKLAQQLVCSAELTESGRITVADFVGPDHRVTGLGEHIADKLSIRLFQSGRFEQILERKRLKQILIDHKQEISGYFDQSTVQQYGQLIGVDSMVIGKIEDLGPKVDITARIVHVGTGAIMGMTDIQMLKDPAIDKLITRTRTASLTVSIKPPVAGTVTAAGRKSRLQNGTATFLHLPYGPCQVFVSAPGYTAAAQSLDIKSRYETVYLNLEARKFDVSFQIVPPDAALSVDGKPINVNEQGFAKVSGLSARKYCYAVSSEGFKNHMDRFNPAQNQLVMIELTPNDEFYALKSDFFKEVQQTENHFNIELWANKSDFRIGENITFYFRSKRDCYLNLVDINSRGELTLLFPNRFHTDNFIRAGRTYRIPDANYGFELEIQPPAGTDRIYAIAGNSPIDIFNSNFDQSAFTGITRGQTRSIEARGIVVKLKNTHLNSAAQCVIHIR